MDLKDRIIKAREGDVAALEQLIEYCQPAAFAQAFSLLGDSHSADDAVQEAFIRMFRSLSTLRSPEAFISLTMSVCSVRIQPEQPLERLNEYII